MKGKYFFFLIIGTILIGSLASAETFGYGRTEELPVNYSNIVINETSNMTEYWNTNEGILDNVVDIEHNWLSNLLWSVAGHIIDTFLDMRGYEIINVSSIQFDLTGNGCVDEGCLEWNPTDGTLDLTMPGGSVSQQIGLESLRRVKANETISNGDVVYPCGGIANRLIICKADYGSIATAGAFGVATEDITKDQFGYVNAFGYVRDIDTTGALGYCSDGSPAWLSSNGAFQCIPPTGDKIKTLIGIIVSTHATNGIIDTEMQVVPRLQGLSQVNGTGITDESIFVYNEVLGIWNNKLRYNFTGLNVTADDFIIDDMTLNGGAYNSIHDWASVTQSSGKISGGIFTSNGDGTVNVSAGSGMIREINSDIAPVLFFDWEEDTSVPLVDDTTNYIHVDYNSGSPTIHSTTDKSTVNNRDSILLGKIFREGNFLHVVEAGMIITELAKRTLSYNVDVFGEVVRASGYAIAETGERYLTTTDGVLWAGLTRITTTAIDTSGADTFEYYYRNGTGGWNENDVSQIDNTHWDDGTGTLNTLTSNRYGVHWVYGDADGHLMVVYGQGDYTLIQAELSQPPATLPDHVAQFGFLAAKIIVQEGEVNLYAVESAYATFFIPSGASIHNELSGLQGGQANEYYHITNQEASGNWTGKNLTSDYTCYNSDCSSYIYNNGTGLILRG